MMTALRSLAPMPLRYPIADASGEAGREVRLLLVAKRRVAYKVYFIVSSVEEHVTVVHVRHWARQRVSADEFDELMDDDVE